MRLYRTTTLTDVCRSQFVLTQHVERMLQVGRIRAGDLDAPAVRGMRERQRPRMQPLALEPKFFRERWVCAVGQVACAWVVQRGEVHSDLVGATGFQFDVEQAGRLVRLQRVVVRDAVATVLGHRELPVVPTVPADRRVDGATRRIRVALHQCVITLFDGALFERPLEHGVGAFGERHHHDTRGADVQAVHDALPLVDSRRADPETRRGEAAEHRRAVPSDGRVRGDARRLVDRDDVVIGVQDRHAFDLDGRILHRRRRFRQSHLKPRARHQLVGLARAGAVHLDAAILGQRGCGRPRQPQQARQPGVDAHPRQSLRDRHRARRHSDGSALRRPTVSKSKPNSDKATSRIAPPTTEGSATLNTGHQPMDRKSTTCPRNGPGERKNRSTRLPMAPPRIMPRPMAHHGDTSRLPIQMMPITTPVAIKVRTHVYPVAIENAAPELRTNVQVMVSPTIDTGWPGVSSLTAKTLVTMSRTSTTAAMPRSSRSRRLGAACVASSTWSVTGSAVPGDSSVTPPSSISRNGE